MSMLNPVSALRARLARRERWRGRCVPLIRQLSTVECGAACLAMVLSYYGRATRVAECRERMQIGRDGASALMIAQAARSYGLRVKACSIEPEQFGHVPLPAIAHWNFDHFVVVERWSPRHVTVADPAMGRRELTAEEFDAGFTGVVLALEPGVQFAPRHQAGQPVWYTFLRDLWRSSGVPGVLAQVFGAAVLLQLLGLMLPLCTGLLVDHVLPYQFSGALPIVGLGMLLVVLAQAATSYLRSLLLIYLQGRLDAQMMLGFFEHVLSLPFRFFQERSSGDLLLRLSSNAMIRELLTSESLAALLDGALVLGYLAVMLWLAPGFGLLVLLLALAQLGLLLLANRRMHGLMQRDLAAQVESQNFLVEALSGIVTLKASGAEDRALDRWSNLFFSQLNIALRRSHLAALLDTALVALRTLAPLALLWFGAGQVLAGALSLGSMLALNALAAACLTPLAGLVAHGQRLQLAGAYLERISDVVEAAPEQALEQRGPTPRLSGRIELRGVSFRYSPEAPWVLRDVDLTVAPGQKVAIVGRTGSGKSTLSLLLLGLLAPSAGSIHYDGLPLDQLDYRAVRGQCGIVLQEPFLFSGSIRQNIAFGQPDLPFDRLVDAAQRAAIHDEINRMPMGYETRLAEGGGGLSGGQRQRLAIARALAGDPAILLFDEATSHLDVVTEQQIDRQLNDCAATWIVIAHRLSTIRNADQILLIDGGQIVEQGTHDELLARGGHYAALVRSQM